jgi:hypothetical protein
LLDVRSYRGANTDSDHYLIIAKIWSRINTNYNKQNGNINTKFEIERPKNPEIAE